MTTPFDNQTQGTPSNAIEGVPAPEPPNQESAEIGEPEVYKVKMKKVREIWDDAASKYIMYNSVEPKTEDWGDYVFFVREHIQRKSRVTTTYIDVKSEVLRAILKEVLKNVRAVSLIEANPSIRQIVLFHFLPELESRLKHLCESNHPPKASFTVSSSEDQNARVDWMTSRSNERINTNQLMQLRLLVNYLKQDYAPTIESLEQLLQREEITYDLLGALFKPGCHVYTKCLGSQKARCVVFDAGEEATQKGVTFFKLDCYYLDHDGHELGEVRTELGILKFPGRRPIRTLDAFPIQYHPDRSNITQVLVERGRQFGELTGHLGSEVRQCQGLAFIMERGKPRTLSINGIVVIDTPLFREMEPNYYRPCVSDCWEEKFYFHGMTFMEEERRAELEKLKGNGKSVDSMTNDDFLICCPTVRCFSFSEKMFLECAVGDLQPVKWSSSFDRLQIPRDMREILLSVTTSRLPGNREVVFNDFIKGKGVGLNILLFGEPGVGKTFTVEAIADHLKSPLYSISASELMVDNGNAFQLENTLSRIFKIAKHVNAILLMDEADLFMEKRSSYHTVYNSLVTIFLRKLENYDGVLFLTTNRESDFDDAILNRLHLKIKYPALTKDARLEIWKNFLREAQTSQGPALIEVGELEHLASMKLNGREIRNLAAIAHALAANENTRVAFRHIEMAGKAHATFIDEFHKTERMNGLYA